MKKIIKKWLGLDKLEKEHEALVNLAQRLTKQDIRQIVKDEIDDLIPTTMNGSRL